MSSIVNIEFDEKINECLIETFFALWYLLLRDSKVNQEIEKNIYVLVKTFDLVTFRMQIIGRHIRYNGIFIFQIIVKNNNDNNNNLICITRTNISNVVNLI